MSIRKLVLAAMAAVFTIGASGAAFVAVQEAGTRAAATAALQRTELAAALLRLAQEIGRAIAGAASGTQQVTRRTEQVLEGAAATANAGAGLRDASQRLGANAGTLRQRVDAFPGGIRAA